MQRKAEWLDIAGKILYAEISGHGAVTLLLIHEIGGSVHSWDELLPFLQPHFRIVRYDIQGNGRSEAISGALDFSTAVADAAVLLDRFGIAGPVVPIGCAVGAAIALGFAATYPARCAAVVALAPATFLPPARREAALARAEHVEVTGTRSGMDEALERSYPQHLRSDPARFERARAMRLAANPRGFAAMMRMLAMLDMSAHLAAIQCPALILAGDYDGDRPPEVVAQVAAAVRGAEFAAIPSGHFMAWQTPDLVASRVMNFLGKYVACLSPQTNKKEEERYDIASDSVLRSGDASRSG